MTDITELAQLRGRTVYYPYYLVECDCGKIYPSSELSGGEPMGESGDYSDCYCPHCGEGEEHFAECADPETAWKAQQDKIDALVEALEKAQQHIARQEQILLNQDESLSIRRGELEAAQQERENWRTSFDNERFRADKLKAHIDDIEPIRAAAEKLVRCKGRYHSEQNYRALAALFGVTTPDLPPLEHENVHYADAAEMEIAALRQRIAELESRAVTIEPFRSFVTDADLAALHRFAEYCDDPESGGHDLEKEQVQRLEAIGALQRSGRISHITDFGDVLISITAGIKVEAER
ncbi:ead/Ea22-like family protein [Klebsiella michiganensis]|uniref:ead/Ea22-like family protein n=1 Tax=Klebsiella michiganensis TaxID=1134687 RepID=UPI003B267E03